MLAMPDLEGDAGSDEGCVLVEQVDGSVAAGLTAW